ncbi:hypothetical protein CHH58_16035 [Terribacillus saccharophilus]|uniref:DUF3139 domain-containing protein n=1 Tax=Terribacillus saccharophilus TaxID=361277 RepID=UPI000BA594FE|nr:DUF3139 domain-containing protein [Terribacillus saccharophilus]PAF35565.1 hypothetical protein CHH58_16035 [Terribacillus saccharophilus]
MSKKMMIITGLVVLLILGGGSFIAVSAYGAPWVAKDAETALNKQFAEKGIDEEQIQSKEHSYSAKFGKHSIYVRFKEESNLRYEYLYRKDEKRMILTEILDTKDNNNPVSEGKTDSIYNN